LTKSLDKFSYAKIAFVNPNPKAIRVLCFGDSNTYGRDPKRKAEEGIKTRFPIDVRWTGQLQNLLGDKFEVIEEGLGGRTTNLDDPSTEGKNGLTYLIPCLESHTPLDLVVLMLGTNDLKHIYNRTAQDVARANKELISVIRHQAGNQIKILLISPITVDETNPLAAENYKEATSKSEQLGGELKKIAQEMQCDFLDLATIVKPSQYDGLHIDASEQPAIAKLIHRQILRIY
jgi:lysophospholipase L1-like esterase